MTGNFILSCEVCCIRRRKLGGSDAANLVSSVPRHRYDDKTRHLRNQRKRITRSCSAEVLVGTMTLSEGNTASSFSRTKHSKPDIVDIKSSRHLSVLDVTKPE